MKPERTSPADPTLVFLHIQKCAGCSLRELLESHFPKRKCLRADLLYPGDPALVRPADAYRLIMGHNTLDDMRRLVSNPLYLTMLRDPVDRVLSLYTYWRAFPDEVIRERDLAGPRLAKRFSLPEFIERPELEVVTNIRNSQAGQLFQGLRAPVTLPGEAFIRQARERLDSFFWVGLVERYDESVDLLCHQLGWKSPAPSPRKNVTADRIKEAAPPLRSEAEARERLEEMNQVDRALYTHARERLEARLHQMKQARRDGASSAKKEGPHWEFRLRKLVRARRRASASLRS